MAIMDFKSINPKDNQIMGIFPVLNEAEIKIVIEKSNIAFQLWKGTTARVKKLMLESLATELLNCSDSVANIITDEMGKPLKESLAEVRKCADLCSFYANHFEVYLQPKVLSEQAIVYHQPLGVILGILPWNFPFWQVFRFAIPTLMAGNTIIMKHAPNTPQCALQIEKIFKKAGFASDVFQSIFVDVSQVEHIISNKKISGVSLTGSTAAGQSVSMLAGKYLKKCVLELGGNDAFIVTKNANVDRAVEKAVLARCRNNGQSCVAAKRFIIDESVFELFKSKLIIALGKLRIGDPKQDENTNGPLARKDLYEKVQKQLLVLEQKKIKKVFELANYSAMLNVIAPSIWEGKEQFDDEIFAPLFLLYKANDLDQIISIANSSSYGLGCSIWSDDKDEIKQLSDQLACGMVYVNELVYSHPSLPFGGIKLSGMGKELGEDGIKEFTNKKLVFTK